MERSRRLVLMNCVISTRAAHQLLVAEAAWMLDQITKWLWGFFWAGKKEVNEGRRFGGMVQHLQASPFRMLRSERPMPPGPCSACSPDLASAH
jgi:hypothetical protein